MLKRNIRNACCATPPFFFCQTSNAFSAGEATRTGESPKHSPDFAHMASRDHPCYLATGHLGSSRSAFKRPFSVLQMRPQPSVDPMSMLINGCRPCRSDHQSRRQQATHPKRAREKAVLSARHLQDPSSLKMLETLSSSNCWKRSSSGHCHHQKNCRLSSGENFGMWHHGM